MALASVLVLVPVSASVLVPVLVPVLVSVLVSEWAPESEPELVSVPMCRRHCAALAASAIWPCTRPVSWLSGPHGRRFAPEATRATVPYPEPARA